MHDQLFVRKTMDGEIPYVARNLPSQDNTNRLEPVIPILH